jgi:hypothetical protein
MFGVALIGWVDMKQSRKINSRKNHPTFRRDNANIK